MHTLVAAFEAADAEKSVGLRDKMIRDAKLNFFATPFGAAAGTPLYREGSVIFPFFKTKQEALKKTGVVMKIIRDKAEGGNGQVIVPPKGASIRGESRYMVDVPCLRGVVVGVTAEMASTASAVMRAIVEGECGGVDAEKISALMSSAGTSEQSWHRDGNGLVVMGKISSTGSGSRGRPQAPPFSVLCAFQERTALHVINGSHLFLDKTDFNESDSHELAIPCG